MNKQSDRRETIQVILQILFLVVLPILSAILYWESNSRAWPVWARCLFAAAIALLPITAYSLGTLHCDYDYSDGYEDGYRDGHQKGSAEGWTQGVNDIMHETLQETRKGNPDNER